VASSIAKNEVIASKRRALVVALAADGVTPLWRGGSLAGRAFVGGASSLAAALGTFTNVRKAFSFTSFTFTANSTTDRITKADHGLETGDGPVQLTNSGGALPGGLAQGTNYYFVKIDQNTGKLAATLADAYAGLTIDITSNGTGTHTMQSVATTQRGLDGEFIYEFTQSETNIDASELVIYLDDKRRAFTASAATDAITLTTHNLYTGMAIMVSTDSGTLPAELSPNTLYYVIRIDADTFKLATTFANALAGTAINLTTDGSGVLYLDPAVFRTRTSVGFVNGPADFWNYVLENGRSGADLLRLAARSLVAKFSKSGNDYVIRDLADSKDSHSSTVTTSGKTSSTIIDPS
jgi:hypothetical protein